MYNIHIHGLQTSKQICLVLPSSSITLQGSHGASGSTQLGHNILGIHSSHLLRRRRQLAKHTLSCYFRRKRALDANHSTPFKQVMTGSLLKCLKWFYHGFAHCWNFSKPPSHGLILSENLEHLGTRTVRRTQLNRLANNPSVPQGGPNGHFFLPRILGYCILYVMLCYVMLCNVMLCYVMYAYIVTYRYALINNLTAWFHHPSPKAAGNVAKNVGHSPASPVELC